MILFEYMEKFLTHLDSKLFILRINLDEFIYYSADNSMTLISEFDLIEEEDYILEELKRKPKLYIIKKIIK